VVPAALPELAGGARLPARLVAVVLLVVNVGELRR
jgi:hypothetical protein